MSSAKYLSPNIFKGFLNFVKGFQKNIAFSQFKVILEIVFNYLDSTTFGM